MWWKLIEKGRGTERNVKNGNNSLFDAFLEGFSQTHCDDELPNFTLHQIWSMWEWNDDGIFFEDAMNFTWWEDFEEFVEGNFAKNIERSFEWKLSSKIRERFK